MTDVTAPALAQALEELHQRLILDHGRGLVMQMFANNVELLRAAAARLRSAETRPQWQPIATAPKNRDVLVYESRSRIRLAWFNHLEQAWQTLPGNIGIHPHWWIDLNSLPDPAAPALPGETPAPQKLRDKKIGLSENLIICPELAPPAVAPVARTQEPWLPNKPALHEAIYNAADLSDQDFDEKFGQMIHHTPVYDLVQAVVKVLQEDK